MAEKKLSVLIIEDEQIYRTLALQVFEGCEKIVAANAEEGLQKFKNSTPDITLLDIGLPDKNGLDLLPILISYDPEAFVVMLTMSRVSSDVKISKERGAGGYIIKPFSYQKVSQCIANYKEYKKKLQNLTSEERAGHILQNLKIEAVDSDLSIYQEEITFSKPKKKEVVTVHELLKTWKILFADDLLVNRERAQNQLIKLGCKVDLAENSHEVLKKTRETNYNLVLLDSKMSPGMNGYDTAKEIRKNEASSEETHKASLIIMADDADELDKRLWQKAGMNDFVKKPASFTKLREIIQKHAKRQINSTSDEYTN